MAILDGTSSTEIAAWWGAITASVVFLWDVYKWKTQGPKLVMKLSPNTRIFSNGSLHSTRFVSVTVSNIGNQPTTIKSVGGEYYTNWFKRFRKQTYDGRAFVVMDPECAEQLPRVLKSGEEWTGLIPQCLDKGFDLEEKSRMGHLMIYISRSDRQRPLRKRLISVKKG